MQITDIDLQAKRARFIELASDRHGGKYDYSKVVMTADKYCKVTIVCPEHGDFIQAACTHITKRRTKAGGYIGCRKCGMEERFKQNGRFSPVCCSYCGRRRRRGELWTRGQSCGNHDCDTKHAAQFRKVSNRATVDKWLVFAKDAAGLAWRMGNDRRSSDMWWRWANTKQSLIYLRNYERSGKCTGRSVSDWGKAVAIMANTYNRRLYECAGSWKSWAKKKVSTMKTASKIQSGRAVRVTASQIYELIQNQGFKCALTGDELDVNDATIDHIIPVSLGGSNEIENLQVVTKAANRIKSNMSMEDLVSVCKKILEVHNGKSK